MPVPVSKHVAAHLFQTCKKEDYIMVYALPTISKAGAESANEDIYENALFVIRKTQKMSTGTAMPSPAENVFSSM